MASSSSGGHMMMPSSSGGGDRKYDVFLSFRGEDTRKTFVGHLYAALQQSVVNAYIDSEDLDKGKRISELLIAIEDSRMSIVVLCQDYASSKWCLRELAKIMECMDKTQQIVVPIFYDVDPSDVRNIKGTFAQAFAKHGANSQLAKEELESWRSALTRFADLSCWDSRDYKDDAKLIKEVVESTFTKLIHTSSNKASGGLVGMDFHIAQMYSRICLEVNDVRVVGIWGMGGLGKTTIAKAVYGEIACRFEHSCFVHNVKEAFTNKREVEVQVEIISQLLNKEVPSGGLNRGWNMIKEGLGRKRVLVVLDDVETSTQIEELLSELHAFGEGSRIIVTTRDKQSLKKADETYLPKCLDLYESCELLMKHAFRKDQSFEEYKDLIYQAIEYSQGLPLALQVLGASLYDKNIHVWKDLLEKIKIIPDRKIMDVLRISFEGLDSLEKTLFLDIACIFRGWSPGVVTEILDGLHPYIGLKNLVNRALLNISYGKLDMHDLLQEMGREIVRRESLGGLLKKPGQHSRLWSFKYVDQVLTQNTATDAIECLMLEFSEEDDTYCINVGAFLRMTKLRVLIICHEWKKKPVEQVTRGELEFLSHELRLLEWQRWPLVPNTFIPKNLVRLDMRGSHIQQLWEGTMPLQNLKEIWLTGCRSLVKIPDLTEAIHLKKLRLGYCSSLLELHSSVSALQELTYSSLNGCEQLRQLAILPSSIHMKSLETLDLFGCSNLEKFPEISDVMSELKNLYLDYTAIKELPESINNLTGLAHLKLTGCTQLRTLSGRIHMSSLECLNLHGCSNFEKFPEISGTMKNLSKLSLNGTAVKGLPSSIHLLEGLQELTMLNCESLESLPDSMCNMTQLTFLDLSRCRQLKTLSCSIHMTSLEYLNLRGCSNFEKFPEISGTMKNLSKLCLNGTAVKGLPLSIHLLE